jgi:transposase
MKRYLGVDLHRNRFTVCTLTQDGKEETACWSIKDLSKFAKTLKETDEVALEATGNTRLFTEALKDAGCRLVVVNPHDFLLICRSVKKTDAHDARLLAEFLSKDMLPTVRTKDLLHAKVGSLVKTRDNLVKLRTALKNRVSNLLASKGVLLKKESLSSEKGLQGALKADLDAIEYLEMEVLVEQIRHLNESIAKLEGAIRDQGPKLPGWESITSIKGIGPVGGTALLAVIGNVNDFADEGKLAAYFGIVPRVSDSNEVHKRGSITKRGSKLGRTVLIQCALIASRYNGYLRAYYQRLAQRRGTGKAIVALARKFLGIIYKTLKNGWIFEDFPKFILARAA